MKGSTKFWLSVMGTAIGVYAYHAYMHIMHCEVEPIDCGFYLTFIISLILYFVYSLVVYVFFLSEDYEDWPIYFSIFVLLHKLIKWINGILDKILEEGPKELDCTLSDAVEIHKQTTECKNANVVYHPIARIHDTSGFRNNHYITFSYHCINCKWRSDEYRKITH